MVARGNYFEDNSDLSFHLKNMVNWQKIFAWTSAEEKEVMSAETWEDYRDAWLSVITSVGEMAAGTISANAERVEREGVTLKENGEVVLGAAMQENLKLLVENGLSGIGIHPRFGGLGGPFFVELCIGEMISRACPSTYLNVVWFSPIAHIVEQFGDEATKELIIPKIASGEWSGSMALTEADAGSDLSSMRTFGEKQSDGTWRIHGSKRFISNGNSEVSLVLAKNSRDASGLKSLSLFAVLRRKEDHSFNYSVTKVEEKVGLHGSATCELNFDGSHAVLLGKEGEGFYYMLRLMNDARIAVGYQSVGLMEAVMRMSQEYAGQRKTWGKPIAEHELIAEMLLDMEVDLKAFRSLCQQAGYQRSLSYLGEAYLSRNNELSDQERHEVEKDVKASTKLVRKWTPLIKWYAGERAFSFARSGLQIHGGYGFTTEYRAEWWVRESLILSLYEGTSQIQALMCVKDTLKDVIRKPQGLLESALGERWRRLREGDSEKKRLYFAKQLFHGTLISLLFKMLRENFKSSVSDLKPSDIMVMVRRLSKDLMRFDQIGPALLHAERVCEIKTLIAMGNCLTRQLDDSFNRRWISQRFFYKAIPRIQQLKSEIEMEDPVISKRVGIEAAEGV